jgi:hypothetical protein
MARPVKKEPVKKVEPSKAIEDVSTLDIQELIKQAVSSAVAQTQSEYENKIKELENQLTKPESEDISTDKKRTRKYKYIPADCRVVIKSNISGLFTYHEDRGKNRLFIEIGDYGQTFELTYEEFSTFYTSQPQYFKRGQIAIIDVIADENADITVEDIIENKQLQSIYFDENLINPMELEEIFTDVMTPDKFEKLLKNSLHMAEPVLEVGCAMYKRGLFNSNAKMNVMKQVFKRPNLFK